MKKSVSIGVDGTVVFFLERMEEKWVGWWDFRVRKRYYVRTCAVPPPCSDIWVDTHGQNE